MSEETAAQKCGATILGPRVARNVVMWTKTCSRVTKHESGRCHQHRGRGRYGPGARR